MESIVNVLVDTFPGLCLPPTLCLPLPATSTAAELLDSIASLLPRSQLRTTQYILTTTSNRSIYACPSTTVADLVQGSAYQQCADVSILPLRLSVPLVGGKGGFGSQLRAAGGRMSSRKKRQNAELATGSARNLDGRRLRTITEAKNLATFLATKPEMDKKEKEERRKRWEQVIELADQREADMRAGKGPDGRRKGLSDEWVEEKEEIGENVRNAVKMAMAVGQNKSKRPGSGNQDDESSGSGGSAPGSEEDSDAEDVMELEEEEMTRLRLEAEAGDADALWVLQHRLNIPSDLLPKPKQPVRRFAGFDEEDDDSSGDDDTEEQPTNGKGKEKVT